jgi:protein associated with RNAse G/E
MLGIMKIKAQKLGLDGEILIEYEGEEIERGENFIVFEAIFTRDDMPFQDVIFKKGDRFVEYYYTDRWYNIFEIYDRDDGQIKGWYCNIGKPAKIEGNLVSYVDLALDLWVSLDGKQTVLDEDEFAELNLNEEIWAGAMRGLETLMDMFKNNKPPG